MNVLLLIAAAVAVFLLKGKMPGGTAAKPIPKGGTVALPNTGTNTTAPNAWSPAVNFYNDLGTKSTSQLAVEAVTALPGTYNAVAGLFGGFGNSATGTASPKTSGSGTAVPEPDLPSSTLDFNSSVSLDNWDSYDNSEF